MGMFNKQMASPFVKTELTSYIQMSEKAKQICPASVRLFCLFLRFVMPFSPSSSFLPPTFIIFTQLFSDKAETNKTKRTDSRGNNANSINSEKIVDTESKKNEVSEKEDITETDTRPKKSKLSKEQLLQEVKTWLREHNFEEYFEEFESNGFDRMASVQEITKEDLKSLNKTKILYNIQNKGPPKLKRLRGKWHLKKNNQFSNKNKNNGGNRTFFYLLFPFLMLSIIHSRSRKDEILSLLFSREYKL
ncbi:hypothetical protein RFI_11087 [Reticulomyxa filosa]|uniref:SAM domain-containing protein n=1 Tax=Reticulomyxa filosa TaxID=46433 RepID=X6NJ71_RETFI|nr:hypothetical protein RFI_11087 [Reticulomyxa filosa]|eukprot:ETO26051.1 hypothetical protein RFI_11087 [Reticulomyxa filosa]